MRSARFGMMLAAIVAASCAKDAKVETAKEVRSLSGGSGACNANQPNRELREFDTDGDQRIDVRKVFLKVGDPPLTRLVLICREIDLNRDGTKDVVRYYTDEGRPLREESDRNFDGRMDQITFFERGEIVRQDLDTTRDGRVDTRLFFEKGRVVRSERDLTGRSAGGAWRPDRWEYYQEGRLVRVGIDVTGDGVVDRWDRNEALRQDLEAKRRAERGEAEAPSEEDDETEERL